MKRNNKGKFARTVLWTFEDACKTIARACIMRRHGHYPNIDTHGVAVQEAYFSEFTRLRRQYADWYRYTPDRSKKLVIAQLESMGLSSDLNKLIDEVYVKASNSVES